MKSEGTISTVDPIEARRHRETLDRASRSSALMLAIGLVVIFLGGVLELRSIYGFAEFAGHGDEPPAAIFMQIVGLPAIILGFFLSTGGARRYTGKLASFPVVGPGTVLFAGFAIGAWWGWSVLNDPNIVLALVSIALTALALLAVVLGARKRSRQRARREVLASLVVSGRVVPGIITDIPEIGPESGGLIGVVTVKFTDTAGVDRWVRKTGQWKRAELPKSGDLAAVLFDPEDPGDINRIWVGPAGSATVADFRLWFA